MTPPRTSAWANPGTHTTTMLQFADLKTQGMSLLEQYATLWGRL
jgi:hypothetical protein